jgi:hypothetical protein
MCSSLAGSHFSFYFHTTYHIEDLGIQIHLFSHHPAACCTGYGDLFPPELSRFKTLAGGQENFEAIKLFRRRKKNSALRGESGDDDGQDSQ